MSLTIDGRAVLETIIGSPDVFSGIPARDWTSVAMKLAKRQLVAGRQSREDVLRLREVLGADVFDKCLDALSAHHLKLLARRVDPSADAELLKTGAMSLMHIRAVLQPGWIASQEPVPVVEDPQPETTLEAASEPSSPRSPNPYIGRKAFRTGR